MDKYVPPPVHNSVRFSQQAGDLCNLLYERKQDKAKINALIDQINAINYKSCIFVTLHDATALITAICLNVKPTDSVLAAKAMHLINNILTRQNLQLTQASVCKVVEWDLACLGACSKIVVVDVLYNLHMALTQNQAAGTKYTSQLIGKQGILLNLIEETDKYVDKSESHDKKLDVILLAIKCLLMLTVSSDTKAKDKDMQTDAETLQTICDVVVRFLYKGNTGNCNEFVYCKAVVHALRVLSQIFLDRHEYVEIPLPELMGLCKHFLLFGLLEASTPQRIAPSQQTIAQPAQQSARGGKKQRVRKQRNSAIDGLKKEIPVSGSKLMNGLNNFEETGYRPVSHSLLDADIRASGLPMTSDSDMSDTEGGRDSKLTALKTRVRQSASNLLLVLIKITEKRDMFGYWWTLLPDCPDPTKWREEENTKYSLAWCAVSDPMSVARAGSLSVVLALLSGSRSYMSQAEMCKREITSFTPFSVRLGHTISCLHHVLCSILEHERVPTVAAMALKCCAALVQATPYHRMQEGLLTELVRVAKNYLLKRDSSMQVLALVVIGCVLSVNPAVEEAFRAVQKEPSKAASNLAEGASREHGDDFEEGYSDDEEIFTVDETSVERAVHFKSWVLDVCFKNLGWTLRDGELKRCRMAPLPLMQESLQVLSAVAFHHFAALLSPHLRLLAEVFATLLESDDLALQTCRAVSFVADAILKLEPSHPSQPPLADCVHFWETLLRRPLPAVLQGDNNAAKSAACDCVANVGEPVFHQLSRRQQVLCVTLLSGSCSDEDAVVRAAAVRALAMCALHKDLREDGSFVSDCGTSILRLAADPAPAVRVKAAWSLGNLSDALVINMSDPEIECLDDDLLLKLLETSLRCVSDNDKLKMSATRAIGNLLRLVNEHNVQRCPQLKTLAETGLSRLVECANMGSNMKIRWNACYAIGNAMKNEALYTVLGGWQKPVLSCLWTLARECPNLKVRITAATALRSPATRAHYGGILTHALRAVLAAVEGADNFHDYTEYKHKDNLLEQLTVTLAHLCCQLVPSDLPELTDALSFHHETARRVAARQNASLPPEHAACARALDAARHVTVGLTAETDAQRAALAMLQNLFISD